MKARSRILYITHASPVPAKIGPSRRHYHILDQLSRFYDVHLLSLGTPEQEELFATTFGSRISHFNFAYPKHRGARKFLGKVWRTARQQCDFVPVRESSLRRACADVATNNFSAIVLSTVLLRDLPLPKQIPIIGDTHNVEFDVLRRTSECAVSFARRQYAKRQAKATRQAECRCVRDVNLLLANSQRDEQLFRNLFGAESTEVIPNGVDLAEFWPSRALGEPGAILFTGLMSYYPNQHAVRWFLDSVFPLVLKEVPHARLVVAGAYPPAWLLARRCASLEVTGAVPDMRPYFDRSRVSVAPLKIGGGTRVKILEAQAMARPVVSTSIGAEGLNMRDGESILIADDAHLFASQLERLLIDDEFTTCIGWNGRRQVISSFDWNRIGEQLESILHKRFGLSSDQPSKRPPHTVEVDLVASHPKVFGTDVQLSAANGHSTTLKRAFT